MDLIPDFDFSYVSHAFSGTTLVSDERKRLHEIPVSILMLQLTFLLYLLLLLGIGTYFFLTRTTRNLSEYMLADRDLGFVPMGLSEAASVASGWTFFAWVGVGFSTGLNGLYFSVFFVLMVTVLYLLLGARFRRQSEQADSLTVNDHLARMVQPPLPRFLIRTVGMLAIVVFFGTYIGTQLKAVGEAMHTGVHLEYGTGVLLGGVIFAAYTLLGGFRASVWTDVLQVCLILVACVCLPIVAIDEIGGWTAFLDRARDIDPTLLTLSAGQEGWSLVTNILVWLTFAFAVVGQPHSLMRFQALRSERLIVPAWLVASVVQVIRMTLPLIIGIAGRVLYEQVENPENVAMMLLRDEFHPALAGLLLAGIISAIISTTDSMILVASTDITRCIDAYLSMTQRQLVWIGRGLISLFAVLGIVLALWDPATIFALVEFAFVGLGVTFGLPLIYLLLSSRVNGWVMLSGMIAGLGGTIMHKLLFDAHFPIWVWPATAVVMGVVHVATSEASDSVPDTGNT